MENNRFQCNAATFMLLTLLLSFALQGCYKEEFPGNPTVALVVKTLNNPFFNDMQDGAEEMARKLELNLIVQAAEREIDVEQQVQIVENLIQRRVDAILLAPSGSREVIPVISKANEAGIPVITLDTMVDEELLRRDEAEVAAFIGSDNYEGGVIAATYVGEVLNGSGKVAILEGTPGHETADSRQRGMLDRMVDEELLRREEAEVAAFIGSDNYEGGVIAATYVGEVLNGSGKVAILEGIPGHETADSRQRGFLDGISKFEGVTVVTSQTANWERSLGYNVFENILQSYPDLDAVFAASDLMALGAVEAIASSGRQQGEIVVVGFDAHQEAVEAVRNGSMHATIAQNPREIGQAGVEAAYKLLNGEEVPEEITIDIGLVTKDSLNH